MKKPKKGPNVAAVLKGLSTELFTKYTEPTCQEWIAKANNQMWNWEECCHRANQAGHTPEQFWATVKLSRRLSGQQATAIRDTNGNQFTYRMPASIQKLLHFIETHLGGAIQIAWPALESSDDQKRYLISSLCEEAISSSEIEGAVVTRKDAKELILKNKTPRNRDEQMVLNNFRTIQMLNQRRNEPLTVEILLEIQREITVNAIDNPADSGRFRGPSDKIEVWDAEDQQILHVPPPASEISERMKRMCEFANDNGNKNAEFIHPVIRAMLLHFWLAYDHPFVDGNGRTARALFYWSMLRNQYWLVEYLTISSIIRKQPKQYARAYLNTEMDDNDLTYFLLYHAQVIEKSILTFQEYLAKKVEEKKRLERVLLPTLFNERQQTVLIKTQKEPDTVFTYESHARAHQVTIATARADLLDLEKKGLLLGNRVGRQYQFVAIPGLDEQLRRLSKK